MNMATARHARMLTSTTTYILAILASVLVSFVAIAQVTPIDYARYWPLLPTGLVIASLAMSTGLDGAVFWTPVLLYGYGLQPSVAISCAICIEIFGFGSGVCNYAAARCILYRQGVTLLAVAVPCGLVGALVSKILPAKPIIVILGLSCIYLVVVNLQRAAQRHLVQRSPGDLALRFTGLGRALSAIGGFFTGLIGVGIGEANHYYLMMKNHYPVVFTSGTSVFMVGVTAFATTVFNFIYYRDYAHINLSAVYNIVLFAAPGVMLGSRVGVRIAQRVERRTFNIGIAIIFVVIAALSFGRAVLT